MKRNTVLLTGASGKLGQAIVRSKYFSNLLTPSHQEGDITQPKTIENFLYQYPIECVIHCAAISKVIECQAHPSKAIEVNSIGTRHLVHAIMEKEIQDLKKIRFIHISTDGVYSGTHGNYSEQSPAIPLTHYGRTKLGAESSVRRLSNYCIIRTSFFDPAFIPFHTSPTDQFSSKMPIQDLVHAIAFLSQHSFRGILNVGESRKSNYEHYKPFKPSLQPCSLQEIQKECSTILMPDASMDCTLWNH